MRSLLCWILLIPLYIVSLLPLRVHYWLSSCIAWLLRDICKYRVSVVYTNLARSFPELHYKELKQIAKDYYIHMTDILCETIWSLTRPFSRIRKKGLFTIENMEVLDDAFDKHGTVVVLFSHAGNWELFSGIRHYGEKAPHYSDYQATFAYRKLENKMSEILFKRMRVMHQKGKNCLMPSNKILRFVIENKGKSWVYFFNSDQYPGASAKIKCTFLNQPTTWFNGGESIARKLGTPVVYFYTDRIKRGKYVLKMKLLCENAAETEEGWVMKQYAALLEEDINNNKVNWLWSHKRWKNIGLENIKQK